MNYIRQIHVDKFAVGETDGGVEKDERDFCEHYSSVSDSVGAPSPLYHQSKVATAFTVSSK